MNPHVSITQLQQLSTHGQFCSMSSSIHFPTLLYSFVTNFRHSIISNINISTLYLNVNMDTVEKNNNTINKPPKIIIP